MGVGRCRLAGTALAKSIERCALPLGHLARIGAEPGRTELAAQRAKAAACLDRWELAVITCEHDFCTGAFRDLQQPHETAGVDHARLVDDHDTAGIERALRQVLRRG